MLPATTYTVKQNGEGDFSVIQEAINYAQHADSIIVYPGTYYETIDYLGKSLHIGSLFLTTADTSYIATTILDGNKEDAVVTIIGSANASLYGFTIQNGVGRLEHENPDDDPNMRNLRSGGGCFIYNSSVNLSFCVIKNNIASTAAGVLCYNSDMIFKGNEIKYNRAFGFSGGIAIRTDYNHTFIFDSVDKNSVFLNTASTGNDVYTYLTYDITIPLKKVSVADLTAHYVETYTTNTVQIEYEEVAIAEVSTDLYVSPDGDDSNSGLSPEDALKTISYANALIKPDSTNIHTIHVANGVYSESNGEIFPIHVKPFVKIIGEDMNQCILDGEHWNIFFLGGITCHYAKIPGDVTLSNFKLINSVGSPFIAINCSVRFFFQDNVHLSNLIFDNTVETPYYFSGLVASANKNTIIDNVNLKMSWTPNPMELPWALYTGYSGYINVNRLYIDGFGGGITNSMGTPDYERHSMDHTFSNVLVSNCDNLNDWPNYYTGTALSIGGQWMYDDYEYKVKFVNSTFADNGGLKGVISADLNVQADFYNCIFYGNVPSTLNFDGRYYHGSSLLKNCLIEHGVSNDVYVNMDWDLTYENILEGNPLFLNNGLYPYALSANSPCVNAGTLDIPDYTFPTTDLAGNQRIYNGQIDIGAYEYQGLNSDDNEINKPPLQISVYPNPANINNRKGAILCNISVENNKKGDISVDIFNSKGQKVKNLMKAKSDVGKFNCSWDGRNDNGETVSSGIYFVKFRNDDHEISSKLTIIK